MYHASLTHTLCMHTHTHMHTHTQLLLLGEESLINAADIHGNTCLHLACSNGHKEVCVLAQSPSFQSELVPRPSLERESVSGYILGHTCWN